MTSKRGEKILKILENISSRSITSNDFMSGFLETAFAVYPSPKKLAYETRQARKRRLTTAFEKSERIKMQKFLYYLKADGLIENKNSVLKLTKAGLAKLEKLKIRFLVKSKLIACRQTIKKGCPKIIIFDIPEKMQKQRRHLRYLLRALDYEMVQKSVWAGETILPEEFIKEIKNLQLVPYLKIFSVYKEGNVFF